MFVLDLAPDIEDRNYAKVPLTKAEIERNVKAAGGPAAVLNTRHKVAKANGWKDKAPSRTAFVKAALEDNNLLRRPTIVRGDEVVVGYDEDGIRELLA